LQAVKAVYYGKGTEIRKQCKIAARGLDAKLRVLEEQRVALRQNLLSRNVSRARVDSGIQVEEPFASNERTFNYYELSWTARLLRLIGEGNILGIDDLRVALPERAFASDSVIKIAAFLRYLTVHVDLRPENKFSLNALLDKAYEPPELEADEVNKLLRQLFSARTGGTKLRDIILTAHLRIILRQACTYVGQGLELSDLFQEGCIGFIVGLDHFRFDKGATFRNYIAFWIRQSILRGIATKSRAIRLPAYVHARLTELQAIEVEPVECPEESWADDQAHVGEDGKQVSWRFSELQRVGINEITEEELHDAMEQPASTEGTSAGRKLDSIEVINALHKILEDLDKREQDVIARRFGLNGRKKETLEQIASDYRLTRERIRQIEENAIETLRHPSRVHAIRR
jgi:RNA polymerase primary sigma factor